MEHGEPIFGTDGIRDRAGRGLLRPEEVRRIIRAAARVLLSAERFPSDFPPPATSSPRTVLIGRDTRASGPGLSALIADTFRRTGFPVSDVGVIPTPGVARLAADDPEALLGVVVSASHNPAEYNGIKFLSAAGAKVSDELERAVSDAYWRGEAAPEVAPATFREDRSAVDRYVDSLRGSFRRPDRIEGVLVAIDTANGATSDAAPRLFGSLGAEVVQIAGQPDGLNINSGCGALHPESLARTMAESGAAIGFCFDGDGDRMIPVAAGGEILDGDHVLAIAGRRFHAEGRLPRRTVVATVMSNLGLEKALGTAGIALLRTPVGDRNVYNAMLEGGHPLGGEQSGHLIFLDDARTGDGLLAAVRLIDCLDGGAAALAEEARRMVRYPQVLLNIAVPRKVSFEDLPLVLQAVAEAERYLNGDGRILLRYSGTEPLARVMIEGPERSLIERLAGKIGEEIRKSI
jgi:phosphoglucosamine mutase